MQGRFIVFGDETITPGAITQLSLLQEIAELLSDALCGLLVLQKKVKMHFLGHRSGLCRGPAVLSGCCLPGCHAYQTETGLDVPVGSTQHVLQ